MTQWPLEPDRQVQERWLAAAARFALDHVASLASAPATGALGDEGLRIAAESSRPIAEAPLAGGMDAALELLGHASSASLTTPGPGYLAYIPGGGIQAAAIADLIAGHVNRFTGLSAAAPALARLEHDVLSWLAREFGLGSAARGILTSGGSLANFSAICCARESRLGEDFDLRRAVAYTSSQAHHSVTKCFRLAGFPSANLRDVAVDATWRLEPAALARQIAADRASGLEPFLVVAAAGTTNTGAVDPLPEIAAICAQEGLWLHVDGAYGGAFVLCDRGRARLAGIERADSITFDPHKGMFLPYGTGCLLVADGEALRRAHGSMGSYLQDFAGRADVEPPPSANELGPELSRDFRGLRLWLPLMLHGARAFREALDEKLHLADRIHEGLLARRDAGMPIEIVAAPQLSIVAWRLTRRAAEPLAAWNARNAAWNSAVNAAQRVHLSSTSLPLPGGSGSAESAFTLRACVLSFRTHADRVDALLEDLDKGLAGATEDL